MAPVLVVDLSEPALERSRAKAGGRDGIYWMAADVTTALELGRFDVWHDRAVFHFLTAPADRARYADLARRTVRDGGRAVIGTFGPEGPESCSGLPVMRYDAEALAAELDGFRLCSSHLSEHRTPFGGSQQFLWAVFDRV